MNTKNLNQEIFSLVSLCNYPPNVTDYLITSIIQIMNYPYVKSKSQYKTKMINKDKIIVVKIHLDVPFHKNNYDVPILVFFPILIPLEPPKIYIELSKDSAINPKVKDIEIKTGKIITPLLRMWEQNTNFNNILNEIRNSFCNIFPVYKNKKNNNSSNTNNNCINSNNSNNIININNNAVFNIINNNDSGDIFANIAKIFDNNFLDNNNSINNNIILNEKNNSVIKNILVEEVFDKISSKLISEYKKLNQQNKTLNNYKNQFRTENEKMMKYFTKKKDIENKCAKDLFHLNSEIKKFSEENKTKEVNKITEENCLNYIKVENPEVIKSIANDVNYEELLVIIKKGFEKKSISFEEAIMSIRNISRDLFINKALTEKRIKKIGKFY